MCLVKKICALDKFLSGMRDSAVGHEFNANESTMSRKQGVFKQNTH